jgi:hypothetical protein
MLRGHGHTLHPSQDPAPGQKTPTLALSSKYASNKYIRAQASHHLFELIEVSKKSWGFQCSANYVGKRNASTGHYKNFILVLG